MVKYFIFVTAAILTIFFSACSDVAAPETDEDLLEYSVEASEPGFTADIVYRNESNDIVTLENEALPWSVSFVLEEDFTGTVYLTALVSADQVFVPYLTGSADSASPFKLIDTTADLIGAGVIAGDKVYSTDDPAVQSSALVNAVEDAHTLDLNTDLFPLGTEPYYIYHKKTLDVEVKLNSAIIGTDTEESERLLSCLVQTKIDM